MSLAPQVLGGFNYLAIFGIIVAAEIGLCKFIGTCAADFKEQFNQLAATNYKAPIQTRSIIKEAITIHQEMLLYIRGKTKHMKLLDYSQGQTKTANAIFTFPES